ncbi:hypothetical protein P8452_27963 [Trifolium repens]|jgi:hypothetical protein|nr:hypothetical protein P8452_27963 [Trifolium repens]
MSALVPLLPAATATNTLVGPHEKPDTDKPKKAPELEIETKKCKVVEGGAAVDGIKMCTFVFMLLRKKYHFP